VTVPAFYLDTTPVTNAAYQEFLADGGYEEPRWWSPAGWDHRQRAGLAAPLYLRRGAVPQRVAGGPAGAVGGGGGGGGGGAAGGGRGGPGPPRRAGRARVLV